MTSSNVSNLLVQVNTINVEMSDSKTVVSTQSGLFEKTLKNVASSMEAPAPASASDNSNASTSNSREVQVNSTKEVKVTKAKDDSNPMQPKEKVAEKIEEVADEIKSIISEELDVSVEDIEKAMEALGFVAMDLLNPQSLAELVANLTGENESITLILSDDFKFILDTVTELTNQLLEETGQTLTDFKDLLTTVEPEEDFTDLLPIDSTVAEEPVLEEEVVDTKSEVETPKAIVVETEASDEVAKTSEVKTSDKPEVVADTVKEEAPVVKPLDEKEASKDSEDTNKKDLSQTKDLPKADKTPEVRTDNLVVNEVKVEPQFIPEQKVVTLPSGETVQTQDIVNQLVEQARILNSAEATTMEMTLNPEGLGKIYLAITQKGDEITAKIFAENDAVKQALESQMANLRLELNSNSSTKVTSIEVSVGTHEFERNLEEDQRNKGQQEQENQSSKRSSKIDLNNMDELSGLMSEEDLLIAQMMQDNGNTLDYQA